MCIYMHTLTSCKIRLLTINEESLREVKKRICLKLVSAIFYQIFIV